MDQVDRVHERLDRSEHDIVAAAAGIEDLPVFVLDGDGHVADRVRAAGDRLDVELLELDLRGRDPEDRVERRIDRAVPYGGEDMLLSVDIARTLAVGITWLPVMIAMSCRLSTFWWSVVPIAPSAIS